MSTILKALRRLEDDRRQHEAMRHDHASIAGADDPPENGPAARWPIAIGAVAALLIGVASILAVLRGDPAEYAATTRGSARPAERTDERPPESSSMAVAEASRPALLASATGSAGAPLDPTAPSQTSRVRYAETSLSPPPPSVAANEGPRQASVSTPSLGAEAERATGGMGGSEPGASAVATGPGTTAEAAASIPTPRKRSPVPSESTAGSAADPMAPDDPAARAPATPAEVAAIDRGPQAVAAPAPRPDPQTGELSEPIPRIRRQALPSIEVTRTTWHPDAARRQAMVRVDGGEAPLRLREGDVVGPLVVLEIRPSGVVFESDGVELQARVGRTD